MLVDTKVVFKEANLKDYDFMEGCLIENNNDYKCVSCGDSFYVIFKTDTQNQLMIVTPSSRNYDPDGGSDFMIKNVKNLIESLISEKIYVA